MEFLTTAFGHIGSVFIILLFFGGSIFVHELGHFLAARWRGVKVERFSIGFGPRIFGWRDKDDIEYRVSWLPLGGYVALPQLADMGDLEGGTSATTQPLPPVSYSSRVIVFVAGAVFNLIFAFALATVLWQIGRPAPESITTTKIGYVAATLKLPDGREIPSPASQAGLQIGDIIRRIDGRPVGDWPQVQITLRLGTGQDESGRRSTVLTVERDGQLRDITVLPERAGDERARTIGIAPGYLPNIELVQPDSSAAKLGFAPGDRFRSFNGTTLHSLDQFIMLYSKATSAPSTLVLARGDKEVAIALPPYDDKKTYALSGIGLTVTFKLLHDTPWNQFRETVVTTFRTLWSLLSPRGDVSVSNLSGPIGIIGGFWDAAKSDYPVRFAIWLAILVNINLAIFNLLPIPVLDGGHIVFATIGKLRGKVIPFNVIASVQSVFVVLLLGMIAYVTVFGDIRRMVRDYRTEAPAKEQSETKK